MIFDNAKQVRQFWTMVCSAVIFAISCGEIFTVRGNDLIFTIMTAVAMLIVLYLSLKEVYNEQPLKPEVSQE